VKNYFLTQDRTLDRKLREWVISIKIDRDLTKDQILEGYLNTIYFGRGAYGVKTAAQAYFGKDVSALTVQESAVLASVMNAPSLFDPALGAKQQTNLTKRVDYVLDGMVTMGWLSAADRAPLTGLPTIAAKAPSRALSGPTGYIVAAVRRELTTKLQLSDDDIDRGGLRITTTISAPAQQAAQDAVAKDFPTTGDVKDVYAGLVAVRPGDGAIVAMYGGADYQARQFSSATDAVIQGGSIFKAFGLIGALQQGISTKTQFDGNSPLRDPALGNTPVRNVGGRSYRHGRPAQGDRFVDQHGLRATQHQDGAVGDEDGGDRGRHTGEHSGAGRRPDQRPWARPRRTWSTSPTPTPRSRRKAAGRRPTSSRR
jgi:membrane peptidoglycan carboxypeptidase